MTLKDKELIFIRGQSQLFSCYDSKDVKKSFIEFDTWLFENRNMGVNYPTIQEIRKQFIKIFGEFTEYKDYKKIINKQLNKENNLK